jgi:hypothetical protein
MEEEGWTVVKPRKMNSTTSTKPAKPAKPTKQTPADRIVAILKKYQPGLSDGYEHYLYYSPEQPYGELTVETLLQHIAKEILSTVNNKV